MVLSLGPLSIANPAGLWALLALVPLIILYLIRPKPKTLAIPSVMFFMQSTGSKKLTSFLKQLTKDWLFIVQLLLLLFLALTFAQPITKYQHDITADNTVIVLDASASSQVFEGASTRFERSVSQAKRVLGQKNTIILAKDIPFIALRDASPDQALQFLDKVSAKGTTSRIGEAIILAGETLGSEGRVVVFSDFINTDGQHPETAKAVLEAKGVVVDFVNTAEKTRSNIGIVGLDASNTQATVYVKNFDSVEKSVPLKVGGTTKQLSISSKGTESFSFKTPAGLTKIELGVTDDFAVDNVAYLSAPKNGLARVLLITNNRSVFLENALLASGSVDVTIAEPPVIPEGEFDVYIIHNINKANVLPGTFEDIFDKLDSGSSVIVYAQEDSDKIDYKNLLPFKLSGRADGGFVSIDQLTAFTKNIEFGSAEFVFGGVPSSGFTVIASVNGVPAFISRSVGSGKLFYLGIPESSEFRFLPSYPIFWTELMKDVTEQQDVRNLNFASGANIVLSSEQSITTPSARVKKSLVNLDEVGLYEFEDRLVAVNLINDRESNINLESIVGTKSDEYELKPVKETRDFAWEYWLIAGALFFALFELWFVKFRGDV